MRRFILFQGNNPVMRREGVQFSSGEMYCQYWCWGYKSLAELEQGYKERGVVFRIEWIDAERECTSDQLRELGHLRETIAIFNARGDWTPDQLHELAQRYNAIMSQGISGETRPVVITTVEAMEQLRKLGLLTEEKENDFERCERVWAAEESMATRDRLSPGSIREEGTS
jgi:hypothetical protein